MFDDYRQRASEEINPEDIELNYCKNIIIDTSKLNDILKDINNVNDEKLYEIIEENYDCLLEEIFLKNNQVVLKLFNEPKFLTSATRVFNTVDLTREQKIYCNKLAYDYITFNGEKDEHVRSLLVNLSKVVNKEVIPNLLAFQLSEEASVLMAMARYSSLREIINVKRLNVVITNQHPSIMTEQMIVNIYSTLFDRVLFLFEGIMFDRWKDDDLEEPLREEVYATINLALLAIIECLPPKDLRQLLITFSQDNSIGFFSNDLLRFNITAISPKDYPRLANMIKYLEDDEHIIIPTP